MHLKPVAFLFAVTLGMASVQGVREQDSSAALIRQGQDAIYRLEYDAAAAIFQRLIKERPEDPAGYGMLAVVYWNDLLTRAGNLAVDDYATPTPFSGGKTGKLNLPDVQRCQQRFHQANNRLLEVSENRLGRKPDDVEAMYFKGLYYENLAGEAIAVTKRQRDAINYGNKANQIHKRVLELDPGFVDAYVSVASHEFARATLPWSIKWFFFLIGIRGDKDKALQELELVGSKGFYRKLDAQVVLALLQSWKGDNAQAVIRFRSLRSQFPENYLLDINLAAVLEQKAEDNQAALKVYQELLNNRKSKAWAVCPGEIHYRIGRLYVRLLDYTPALAEFEKAVKEKKAERETEPLAYFQMAQIYEQRNEEARAAGCYRRVLEYRGSELDSEIKTARRKVK